MNLLFDLGNVVLDWNPEKIIASLNLPDSKKQIIKHELLNHTEWLDLDTGITTEAVVSQRISTNFDISNLELEHAFAVIKNSLTEISETLALMESFNRLGLKMYCLSNMSIETYEFIKGRDFFDYFQGICISGQVNMIKPDPNIFKYCLEEFSLSPENTLFIDDSLPNILAARNLGINAFHFKRTKNCYKQILAMVQSR